MFHAQEKKAVGGTGFKDEPDVYITDPDFKGAVVITVMATGKIYL
jgi:hypothetical protein